MNDIVTPEDGSIADLQAYMRHFVLNDDGTRLEFGDHFFSPKPHFRDVNREVVAPGQEDEAPEGGVGIRGDWDFWILAYLPYRFRNLSCAEIAGAIWPEHASTLEFLPDTGDYWWTAQSDDSLEVPGEPYEVWATCNYTDDRDPERMRIDTFSSMENAVKRLHKHPPQENVVYEILVWQDGERRPSGHQAPRP